MNFRFRCLLKGTDQLMHAALAHRAPTLLHRPERELSQAAQNAATNRPENAERLRGQGIGVERRLRIERFTVLVGRARAPLAPAEADGSSEVLICLQRTRGNLRRAGVLRVGIEDHLQRTADGLAAPEVPRRLLKELAERLPPPQQRSSPTPLRP